MNSTITFQVNGKEFTKDIPNRMLLVDLLRDELGLTGVHQGCTFEGVCGACTIHLNGEAIKSCMMLAVQIDGAELTTIEGLAEGDTLHPVQKAFNEHHGLQCGYCTAGMIMNAVEFLKTNPKPSEAEIRQGLIGNICRCTGYQNIVKAVAAAAEELSSEGEA